MPLIAVKEYATAEEMMAAYRARLRPKAAVVPMERVRVIEPEPTPQPEEIPDFLAIRKREDWIDLTTKAALRPATARVILSCVRRRTCVSHLDITSKRRTAGIAKARMIACWIMRHHTPMSLPQIGKKLGGRDHTTVLHAVNRVEAIRAEDASYKAFVDGIVADVEREMSALQDSGEVA